MIKRLRHLFVLALFTFPLISSVSAQTVEFSQSENWYKLSFRLQKAINFHAGDADMHRVGILLSDRVDIEAVGRALDAEKATPEERSRRVITALQSKAAATQPQLLQYMRTLLGVDYDSFEPYWITNIIYFEANRDAILALTRRSDVEFIDLDAKLALDEPELVSMSGANKKGSVGGHEPGHDAIDAPFMWSLGYTGYGRLLAGFDTGVNPAHPALRDRFNGNFKSLAESWFVYQVGAAQPSECGSSSHGTHTMGTMLGMDPATDDTIGVAMGARWIGSPALCGSASGTAGNIAAFQWAMNPDNNMNTANDLPDAICNSWYDPSTTNECNGTYRSTFDALEAIGVAVVFSAGNSGPSSASITQPKNINNDTVSVFAVGNVNGNNPNLPIANSSSRGPSTCGGSGSLLIKPEVSAPGTSVRSCVFTNQYSNYTGTSMAAPHVCGAIALLKEAFPNLTGRQVKLALYYSAIDLGTTGEDNTYGMGIINLRSAYNYLIARGNTPKVYKYDAAALQIGGVNAITCNTSVTPTLTLENQGDTLLTSVTITYTYTPGGTGNMTWTGSLAPGASTTVTLPAFTVAAGNIDLKIATSNPNGNPDDRPFNDEIQTQFTVTEAANVVNPTVSLTCPGPVSLQASGTSQGTIKWYTSPGGGTEIGTGTTYITGTVNASTTFYADVVNSTKTGQPSNQTTSGGFFTSDARFLIFDAYSNFKLKSVLVYADGGGNRTIELRTSTGFVLDSRTVNIPNGTQRVQLDFDVQPGTDLQLAVSGNVDLYRSNGGLNYPYEVPGVLSIKFSNAGTATGFYYFFYDWDIEYGSPCGRTPVSVQVANPITARFNSSATQVDLSSSGMVNFSDQTTPSPVSWAWDFGDGNTSTQQNPMHTYTSVGTYNVCMVATEANGCTDSSCTVVNVFRSVGVEDAMGEAGQFELYPNPTNGIFSLRYLLEEAGALELTLFDIMGRSIERRMTQPGTEGILQLDLSGKASGTYYLRIKAGERQVTLRVLRN